MSRTRPVLAAAARLHVIGEDRAEMLDYVPAQFRVRVIRRPRYGCRACEGRGRAGARAGPSDRRRHGDRGAAGARADQQIRRPPAAVSPGADLRPPGHDAGSFHLVQLGRPRLLVAGAAARADAEHRAGLAQGVRRRHDVAGARSRPGTHQDRTAVVLRGRQPPVVRARPSGRRLCLQRGPQGRASGGHI